MIEFVADPLDGNRGRRTRVVRAIAFVVATIFFVVLAVFFFVMAVALRRAVARVRDEARDTQRRSRH